MSQQGQDKDDERHARKPCRSTSSGDQSGGGAGGGPGGQRPSPSSNRSFWSLVNALGGHHQLQLQLLDATAGLPGTLQTPAPRPQHHGEPSKGLSSQFDSINLEGIPFHARTSILNLLDGHKLNQALPGEQKVAPSSPVQLDPKQQPVPHQPNQFVGYQNNAVGITHAETHKELKLDKRMELSPVTPMQIMHKAKKKYVVGKVSDQEEVKQRQLNAILNKLTARNLDKLFKEVKKVNIDNISTLAWFVSQIFYRVLTEPTFCRIYAIFCYHLARYLPDFSEDYERITFKRLLLNKCQEEFERCERKEAEAGKTEEQGGINEMKEEREERTIGASRRMLGNIRFIGELYKNRMLTEGIMHRCIKKLFGDYSDNPDEEKIEGLCTLMSTIGEMIDLPKSKGYMDDYFDIVESLSRSQKLSFRVRFLLRDLVDLRKNKWQEVKGESRA